MSCIDNVFSCKVLVRNTLGHISVKLQMMWSNASQSTLESIWSDWVTSCLSNCDLFPKMQSEEKRNVGGTCLCLHRCDYSHIDLFDLNTKHESPWSCLEGHELSISQYPLPQITISSSAIHSLTTIAVAPMLWLCEQSHMYMHMVKKQTISLYTYCLIWLWEQNKSGVKLSFPWCLNWVCLSVLGTWAFLFLSFF